MVSKPAKVEVFESHSGAETIPKPSNLFSPIAKDFFFNIRTYIVHTVLYQNRKTALHK